jgi:hypothetical protein
VKQIIFIVAVFIAILLLSGCQTRTDYGRCIGLGEKQNPKLVYRASARNIVVGIVFIELIIPPVVVATEEIYCPIDKVNP